MHPCSRASLGALFCGALSLAAACRDAPIDPMDKERRGPLVLQEQPPLPEDPVAGKRSELQWQKHLQAEERERQMLFDRNRLAQHRELIKNIKAARERLDQPKTAKALQQAREQLEPTLQALQQSIDEVDRYKNSSHLLGDYDALMDALKQSYPQARLAAMSGKPEAQAQARSDFDARLRAMHAWLVRSEDLDEAAEEGE